MSFDRFQEALRRVMERTESFASSSATDGKPEEATKDQLLTPLIEALGYGPDERTLEGAVVSLTSTTGWVDYFLKADRRSRPWLMVEAKPFAETNLWQRHQAQILRYIRDYAIMVGAERPVEWIVLTNVREWWFVRLGERDPFWTVTLSELADESTARRLYGMLAHVHIARERMLEFFHERRREDLHERTSQFLRDLKRWRVIVANGLRRSDPKIELEAVRRASHRLLLRFLLVRVLEAHGNEPYFSLGRELQHWRTTRRLPLMRHLRLYFEGAWRTYNTELLAPAPEDDHDVAGEYVEAVIAQDAEPPAELRVALGSLDDGYRSIYNYDFSTLEHDVLGTAYEQFLAHEVVERSDGRLGILENAETRKREGVYYTPGYVVDEIVRRVVGPRVEPAVAEAVALVREGRFAEAHERARSVLSVRILDPACGSGSFLIRAHRFVVDALGRYEAEVAAVLAERRAGPVSEGSLFDDGAFGREEPKHLGDVAERVLVGCIFGVDLDAAAVELARLALWTQLLRSAPGKYGRPNASRSHLPSLALNVRHGNSLVDPAIDGVSVRDRERIAALARQARDPIATPEARATLADEVESALHEVRAGLAARLGDVFERPDEQRPFAWALEFPDVFDPDLAEPRRGFDAVVGNPPYYNVDRTFGAGSPMLRWLERRYPEVWADKTDVQFYFFARAGALLRDGGGLGFVVSRSFLQGDKSRRLRRYLAESLRLDSILDFLGARVFAAGIATAVLVATRGPVLDDHRVRVEYALDFAGVRAALEVGEPVAAAATTVRVPQSALRGDFWPLSPFQETVFPVIDQHASMASRGYVVGQGMQTGLNEAFVLDRAQLDRLGLGPDHALVRRLATNRNLAAYRVAPLDEYVLWVEDTAFEALPAAVQTHLESFRPALEDRAAYRRGNCAWYRFTWPLHAELLDAPRLLHSYRAGRNGFVVDEAGTWLGLTNTTTVFPRADDDPYALAVVLNSPVAEFRHRTLGGIGKATSTGMYEYFANQLERWPLPELDPDLEAELAGLGRSAHDGYRAVFERAAALERTLGSVPSVVRPLAAYADPAGPFAPFVEVVGVHPDEVGVLYGLSADVVGTTLRVEGEVGTDDGADRVRRRLFDLTGADPDVFEFLVHEVHGACQAGAPLARRAVLSPGASPANVFETALNVLQVRDYDVRDVTRHTAVVRTLVARAGGGPRLTATLHALGSTLASAADAGYRAYGVEAHRSEIEDALALVT